MSTGFGIDVIYVDGRTERFDFTEQQAMVGSAHDADLCLPLEELSPKHILIVGREKGCWVSVARGVATPVLYQGHYVDSQEVPWGAELDVGTVTLRIGEPIKKVEAREASTKSLYRIGGLAVLALAAFYFFQKTPLRPPKAPATAPSIVNEAEEVECTASAADATDRAAELLSAAPAYWQRYPFDAQEGIRAARLFGEASSCFARLNNRQLNVEMKRERQEIVKTIKRDYHTYRLQLSRALKNKEHVRADYLVGKLANFLQHRPGEYTEWLGRVNRYLRKVQE